MIWYDDSTVYNCLHDDRRDQAYQESQFGSKLRASKVIMFLFQIFKKKMSSLLRTSVAHLKVAFDWF